MAIGADRTAVLRMVLRQGIVLALAGLVLGLLGSVGAGNLLGAAVPSEDNSMDWTALLLVTPAVLAVTLLAAYLPARRASGIQPMQALRMSRGRACLAQHDHITGGRRRGKALSLAAQVGMAQPGTGSGASEGLGA
jgi:predicted lysophospholipase L1 biosynthesis ABC-type transport system permease subunit